MEAICLVLAVAVSVFVIFKRISCFIYRIETPMQRNFPKDMSCLLLPTIPDVAHGRARAVDYDRTIDIAACSGNHSGSILRHILGRIEVEMESPSANAQGGDYGNDDSDYAAF